MRQFFSYSTTTTRHGNRASRSSQGPEKIRKIVRPQCLDGVATANIVKWKLQTTLYPENMVTLLRQLWVRPLKIFNTILFADFWVTDSIFWGPMRPNAKWISNSYKRNFGFGVPYQFISTCHMPKFFSQNWLNPFVWQSIDCHKVNPNSWTEESFHLFTLFCKNIFNPQSCHRRSFGDI